MSFDKGYYNMGSLPSRQLAQRDLVSNSRLKLRTSRQGGSETAVEKLKRLKRELEEREGKASKDEVEEEKAERTEHASKVALQFNDADEESSASDGEEEGESDDEQNKQEASAQDEALQKELERVRAERRMREEAEAAAAAKPSSNPLLEKTSVQRRWDDDVIFRNQARNEPVRKEKRFVNDIVRSDVHKDFLKKHIL